MKNLLINIGRSFVYGLVGGAAGLTVWTIYEHIEERKLAESFKQNKA